jgi:LacI family transcriptional regulator
MKTTEWSLFYCLHSAAICIPFMTRTRQPVVALLIETSNAFSREVLRGVHDWMRAHARWTIHLSEQGRGNKPPDWLKRWRGDGIIARIETVQIARAVKSLGVPVVNVSASGLAPEIPAVISDSAQIAQLAANHLFERGFTHYAYCGDGRFAWSRRHEKHFASACDAAGHSCDIFPTAGEEQEQARIQQWLKKLPKPVGIMTCYDIRGQQVLDACRALGLRVPDEVAVISQHNDELLCELCDPPLSSVIPAAQEVGAKAAAMLDQLMRGKRKQPLLTTVPPRGIATRLSTDTVAVADAGLAAAVRHVRDHACEPLLIDDLARVAGMARTKLERLFREHLGVSPYEQALRHRITRAQLLLRTTSLSIADIAERTGFSTVEHFANTFKKRTGSAPGAARHR